MKRFVFFNVSSVLLCFLVFIAFHLFQHRSYKVRAKIMVEPDILFDHINCSENLLAEAQSMYQFISSEIIKNSRIVCKRSSKVILVESFLNDKHESEKIVDVISSLIVQTLKEKSKSICTNRNINVSNEELRKIYLESYLSELHRIREKLVDIESKILNLESFVRDFDKEGFNIPPIDEIKDIFESYKSLEIRKIELLSQYTEKSPQINVLDEQIRFVSRSIKKKILYEIRSLKNKRELLLAEEKRIRQDLERNYIDQYREISDGYTFRSSCSPFFYIEKSVIPEFSQASF
ncbi:MAG: hypothetical protein NZ927_00690 [Candidatus Calescibacterium sp.]|nr:hypothetical protein [Candidatus Calescibacterium sp.]MCX7733884.1 hypothetical protein [bacterium]MDW8086665.1 hypothetical protein [Candidatus Calescibacterium sp.]